ncbi:PQQ-dependent sugar dehydrogenase [Variovorax sp. RHLX14]|uniref:PQQ-dependent sugar dehydrogenase n=1 Tax=Variovorax sp. RHLX14 TaxID=1259731 RepID=UPI003F46FDEB
MQPVTTLGSSVGPLRSLPRLCLVAAAVLLVTACGETAKLPFDAGVGPTPQLPVPNKTLIPTLKIAEAIGWNDAAGPTAPQGFKVTALARQLDHPRWVFTLPNGDVLVAESNKPPKEPNAPQAEKGLFDKAKGVVQGMVMKRAGAGVPSANRITLLRDVDGDGTAETRSVYLQGLNSPYGMALVGNELFIANADAIVKVPYVEGQTAAAAAPVKVTDLPAGINHHWTKNIIASRDGTKLYATVGSNSNIGENGMQAEEGRAAIWEVDVKTGAKRLFASGLRNPNGLGWEPDTGALWTVVNERDEIGSDLVPDYLTSVKDGAFYGWPWSYYGKTVDARVLPQQPDKVATAIAPDYALGTHVAPLGLAFSNTRGMPPEFASGAFVGNHGSWNRKPMSGYNVVFVPFIGGRPVGKPVDFLTGFLSADGKAQGRPVGVALDKSGALLVADDVGNVVWRVSKAR